MLTPGPAAGRGKWRLLASRNNTSPSSGRMLSEGNVFQTIRKNGINKGIQQFISESALEQKAGSENKDAPGTHLTLRLQRRKIPAFFCNSAARNGTLSFPPSHNKLLSAGKRTIYKPCLVRSKIMESSLFPTEDSSSDPTFSNSSRNTRSIGPW